MKNLNLKIKDWTVSETTGFVDNAANYFKNYHNIDKRLNASLSAGIQEI